MDLGKLRQLCQWDANRVQTWSHSMHRLLPPQRIVIVGGGSAGWMAAAYLRKKLSTNVPITLVESPRVGKIGVGEGTIPIIRDLIELIGLEERNWMTACEATFKLGIRFNNWLERGSWWWHPFYFNHPQFPEKGIVDSWLAERTSGRPEFQDLASLKHGCMSWQLAKGNRAPRFLASVGDFEGWDSDHAFHFDAHLFGQCLQAAAKRDGVRHVVDHIVDVCVNSKGHIASVTTESQGAIEGDFFLDCSGFRRLLMEAVSDSAFISYGQELFCDAAVTLPVAYEDPAVEMRPYTVATALNAGWVWQISLYHRIGVGYVYSSRYLDRDDAERELREFIGPGRVDKVAANHLRFAAGRLETPWVKNCVAIGLAEGFVEPLEATALGVAQHHLKKTAEIIASPWEQSAIDQYNRAVAQIYAEVKRFLVAHYCHTARRDTQFWRDVAQLESPWQETGRREELVVPRQASVFAPQSWTCLAAGFDCLPRRPTAPSGGKVLSFEQLAAAQQSQQRVLPGFLHQWRFLQSIRRPHS